MGPLTIISIHSYLTLSFGLLFSYQAFINFIMLKQKVLDPHLIRPHIGLCLFSALYSFSVFLMSMRISLELNLYLLMVTWIFGSLILYYYIHSVKSYLEDKSKHLNWISYLPLLSALGALLSIIFRLVFDVNFIVDPVKPIMEYNNLFMQHIGPFKPHIFINVLGLFIAFPTLYTCTYFLRLIYHSKSKNRLLAFGVIMSFLIFINDIAINFVDPTYLVSLMFLANVFEILRITYSHQIQLGMKLHELRYSLIQSNKFIEAGSYYSLLAHEIMSPLQAARLYLGLIDKKIGKNLGPELGRYFEIIDKQHQKIFDLTRNVKDFTRVGSPEDLLPCAAEAIIQDALDTINVKAYYAGVELRYKSLNHSLKIRCVHDQIVQVLTNLLNNAIDAISDLDSKWIQIFLDVNEKRLKICLRDSGSGVPKDLQLKMWERNFSTKASHGNGLGLSICRDIISSHNGEIYLNPLSGNTEFVIDLPLHNNL
jgi:signal transduction histidine kinase